MDNLERLPVSECQRSPPYLLKYQWQKFRKEDNKMKRKKTDEAAIHDSALHSHMIKKNPNFA